MGWIYRRPMTIDPAPTAGMTLRFRATPEGVEMSRDDLGAPAYIFRAPVHDRGDVDRAPRLPKDISHKRVRKNCAELVLYGGNYLRQEVLRVHRPLVGPIEFDYRIVALRDDARAVGLIHEQAHHREEG